MANVIVQRSNRFGIPLIQAQGIVTEGTKTVVTFNNHVNLNDNFIGVFLVKFPTAVAGSTNEVVFRTIDLIGSDVPAYYTDGTPLEANNISSEAGPTYHMCLYDRVSNRLQLLR